jgi:hypothetical protein
MADAPNSANTALGSMPIGERLRDMGTPNRVDAREIRDRPRDSHNARSATAGKPQAIHRLFD